MNIHYQDDEVTLHHGDCLDVLAELPDASVDSVVTDPPYGLDFMGKHWDTGAVAFDTAIWGHALRVLKPGGHVLAFGGSRTWHRLAVAIEDAGFELRDSIAWLYGSGFPKSLDVSKAIDKAAGAEREQLAITKGARNGNGQNVDCGAFGSAADGTYSLTAPATYDAKQWQGWGTALKPAFEPIVVGRKPINGTVAANVVAHGTGALNIDRCRVAHANAADLAASHAKNPGRTDSVTSSVYGGDRPQQSVNDTGRWPANVVIDESQADELDKQSGVSVSRKSGHGDGSKMGYGGGNGATITNGHDDTGGASRFFPTFRYEAKAPTSERPSVNGTAHPTVKPLDLMRWLVRLVTPPHGLVLDPFAGSGTTAEAAVHEHMRCITIEREADYLPLIVARLSKPVALGFDFDEPAC